MNRQAAAQQNPQLARSRTNPEEGYEDDIESAEFEEHIDETVDPVKMVEQIVKPPAAAREPKRVMLKQFHGAVRIVLTGHPSQQLGDA